MTYAPCNAAIFEVLQVENSFLVEVTIFMCNFVLYYVTLSTIMQTSYCRANQD